MRTAIAVVMLALTQAVGQPPWPVHFMGGQDGVWTWRLPLRVNNTTDGPLRGFPVAVPVGDQPGEAPLVGQPAQSIRVATADGIELLFDLTTAAGVRLTTGPIPAGATLTVPVAAEPGETVSMLVYAGNPQAYQLPEFLPSAGRAVNGSFELGDGAVPDGWQFDASSPTHRLRWARAGGRTGTRCVVTEVDAGASPEWIAARQRELAVLPGRRYRVSAWVKAEQVVGRAGWYFHCATSRGPMTVNGVESAGEGSYDWRQVTMEFTAPEDALQLSHGTVLHGTGRAWFDDAEVVCLDPLEIQAEVGRPEQVDLREHGVDPAWPNPTAAGPGWEGRVPILVDNLSVSGGARLVQVRASSVLSRVKRRFNPASLRLYDPSVGRFVGYHLAGDDLLFATTVEAWSRHRLWLYFSADPRHSAEEPASLTELITAPSNLVVDPSFEAGEAAGPGGWVGSAEGADQSRLSLARTRGGVHGEHCAKIQVAADAPLRWVGWRQAVQVQPQSSYFYAAWVRTSEHTGSPVKLHAHLLSGDGTLVDRRYWSSGSSVAGDSDWTMLSGLLTTGANTRAVNLHLTMNARGTVAHDGVIFAAATVGHLGELEARDAAVPGVLAWLENPVVKVFWDDLPGPAVEAIRLSAGRGEQEAVQLCLRSAGRDEQVRVTFEAPRQQNAALPVPRLERVGYVPVLEPGGYHRSDAESWQRQVTGGHGRTDGWRGWWPDYLAPVDGAVALPAGRTQPLWLTFDVPRDTAPGEYTGSVTLTPAAGAATVVPVRVTVWRQVLPERPSLQVIYDLRNGRGMRALRDTADHHRWWRFMAERRISADHIVPEPTFRLVDGQVQIDAEDYLEAGRLWFDTLQMATAYWPRSFYACGWAHPPRPFLGIPYGEPGHKEAYQGAIRQFHELLRRAGWADRMSLYISDEPHYYSSDEVVGWLGDKIDMIREVNPSIPVYSSTWGHEPRWDNRLNHWGIAQYGRFPMDEARARAAAGDKIWFTTDGQMEIDTPYNACERLLPYYCFAHGASGYEFWGISWYTYNPYEFGWHSYIHQSSKPGEYYWTRYPNGDGYLAYPGEPIGVDGPVSTIRLEQAREGIEDYEHLVALRQLADRHPARRAEIEVLLDRARQLAFIPNAGGYRTTEILPDPDALTRLRDEVGAMLDELLR